MNASLNATLVDDDVTASTSSRISCSPSSSTTSTPPPLGSRPSVVVTAQCDVRLENCNNLEVASPVADNPDEFILFLLRHGEAEHNVAEHRAKEEAKAAASARGLTATEVKAEMEEARRAVLEDHSLHDPPLTHKGTSCCVDTRARINELLKLHSLPPPALVLVSPLQRTLQTATLIFPGHAKVQAREELRERQTGFACDERSHAEALRQRQSFAGIDFADVLRLDEDEPAQFPQQQQQQLPAAASTGSTSSSTSSSSSSTSSDARAGSSRRPTVTKRRRSSPGGSAASRTGRCCGRARCRSYASCATRRSARSPSSRTRPTCESSSADHSVSPMRQNAIMARCACIASPSHKRRVVASALSRRD